MPNNKRKHFFINKSLQARYIMYIVLTLSIVSVCSGVAIYFGIWNSVMDDFSEDSVQARLELTTRFREYQDARGETTPQQMTLSMIKEVTLFALREREVLNTILASAYQRILPFLLLLFFFIGWGSIFITHKIAGPLFRLQDSLRKISTGKLNFKINLRKLDEAQDIVPVFNECVARLDTSMARIKKASAKLKEELTDSACPAECLTTLNEIIAEANQYETGKL